MANRRPGGLRARDTDRNAAVAALDNAYADGQLGYEEHSSRVSAARAARTIDDLHGLTSDLQLTVDMPEPAPLHPRGGRARPWVVLGAAVAAMVAGVVFYASTRGDADTAAVAERSTVSVPTNLPTDASPIVAPPVVLDTPDGLRAFVDQYRTRFGDTMAVRVLVYPDDEYGSVTRVVEASRTQDYSYRGGFDKSGSPGSSRDVTPIDLATLNVDALAGLMAGAGQTVGVPDATVSHVSLENDGSGPTMSIYAGNEFSESGYLKASFAGDIVAVYPFRN
ncbi:MAG TPA: DUF1707 domain-containing protein [Aldersonia sp.]